MVFEHYTIVMTEEMRQYKIDNGKSALLSDIQKLKFKNLLGEKGKDAYEPVMWQFFEKVQELQLDCLQDLIEDGETDEEECQLDRKGISVGDIFVTPDGDKYIYHLDTFTQL